MSADHGSRDPLHGMTLEAIVTFLVAQHGFAALAERLPIRCFQNEPSVASSLKFLRRTPWARRRVEELYLDTIHVPSRRGGFRHED
jgi:uncharacterized protein (DUF2132 family)